MKPKKIYYERTFNLGNYESEKVGIEIEVIESNEEEALNYAKTFVETNNTISLRSLPKPDDFIKGAADIVDDGPIDDLPW